MEIQLVYPGAPNLIPFLHVAGFEVVCEQHIGIARDTNVTGIPCSEAPSGRVLCWCCRQRRDLKFGQPFLRSAINPCRRILFAQALEGSDRFISLAGSKETICL